MFFLSNNVWFFIIVSMFECVEIVVFVIYFVFFIVCLVVCFLGILGFVKIVIVWCGCGFVSGKKLFLVCEFVLFFVLINLLY